MEASREILLSCLIPSGLEHQESVVVDDAICCEVWIKAIFEGLYCRKDYGFLALSDVSTPSKTSHP